MKKSKNIIVSGATGFIGMHLIKSLVKNNYKVTIFSRDLNNQESIVLNQELTTLYCDISKRILPKDLPQNATLVHLAWGDVHNTQSLIHIEKHLDDHYFFIKEMLGRGIKNLVITGTCYEYGLNYGPISATSKTNPITPYAIAKDSLHKRLRTLQKEICFNLVWARLFYMYGEGQNDSSIVPLFDKAICSLQESFEMSYGEQLLDYLPVEKVAEKLMLLISKKDGIFNVCSGQPISLRRFLEERARSKNSSIKLDLGRYPYRPYESIAIWGDPHEIIDL